MRMARNVEMDGPSLVTTRANLSDASRRTAAPATIDFHVASQHREVRGASVHDEVTGEQLSPTDADTQPTPTVRGRIGVLPARAAGF